MIVPIKRFNTFGIGSKATITVTAIIIKNKDNKNGTNVSYKAAANISTEILLIILIFGFKTLEKKIKPVRYHLLKLGKLKRHLQINKCLYNY